MGASIQRFIEREVLNAGLDAATADPWLLQRTQVLSASLVAAISLAIPLGLLYGIALAAVVGLIYVSAIVGWVGCFLVLRWTRRPDLCGRLALGVMWYLMCSSFWHLGGLESSVMCWALVLPIAAVVVADARSARLATGVTVATCIAFWAMPQLGLHPENPIPPERVDDARLLFLTMSSLVIGTLVAIWNRTQRALEGKLAESLVRANEEAANVALLLDASGASNASGGFQEIAERIVESMGRSLGAPFVRIWYRAGGFGLDVAATHHEPGAIYEPESARELMPSDLQAEVVDLSHDPSRRHDLLFHPIRGSSDVVGMIELHLVGQARRPAEVMGLLAHVASQLGHVAERERSHEAIRELAYVDPLSGLPNRLAFQERLPRVLEHLRERGLKAGVLFIDLNGFKRVNDSLGHDAGDVLLRTVADRLKRTVRMSDHLWRTPVEQPSLARFGGDEFTVLAVDIADAEGAINVARRILGAMGPPVNLSGHEVVIGASIGIAVFPDDGERAEELIQRADTAMYRAKQSGTNAWRRWDGSSPTSSGSVELEADLRRALDEDALALHYQPIVRARDGALLGAEALMRWTHPTRGSIPPMEFIAVAESTGLIGNIGRWALAEAARQVVRWEGRLPEPFRVAVNVSPRQLLTDFDQQVADVLRDSRCPAQRLEIEITETALMVKSLDIERLLASVAALGVKLVLDDFGTGYSSLSFLKRFPIAKVKIDRSFVRGLPDQVGDVAIVRAILGIVKSLGLTAVAEGVEDEAQHDFLTDNGCDAIQGYLFGHPVSASEFAQRWLTHERV